jgi:hypothetical protein
LCGEEAGSEQVVGETVRSPTYEVSSRWSYNNDLCFPREPDVIQRVARTEDLSMDRPSRDRLESDRSNELSRAASHHDIDFSTCLRKQTRQPH